MEARRLARALASLLAGIGLAVPALACLLVLGAVDASAGLLQTSREARDGQLFNLVLRHSSDPDLLSAREAALRQKLIDMGVGPGHAWERPTTSTLLQRRFATAADWYRELGARRVEILEVDYKRGQVIVYRFPETSLFFTDVDTNLVGIAFEQPRDMHAPELEIEMDGLEGWNRHWTAIGLQDKWSRQLRSLGTQEDGSQALLNFTIPIKLPRTLERIIGRGDATNIRISGTETISIGGSSTRRSDFVASEIQQSQSLFPTLEMQQTLQVNLDGTVGEKIKVRVSHDSQRLGSESTEVKLAFEGDEDDIIQTIRAGNIDVTLPGSRLLGVSASTGGLFGVKVEGALGPLEFTLLTSKEQSQQNTRNFSQQGGSEGENVIRSTDYAKGRFFRLIAPRSLYFPDPSGIDPNGLLHDESASRWLPGWRIEYNSLELFVSTGAGASDENTLDNAYAFVDSSGIGWEGPGLAPLGAATLATLAATPNESKDRWRRLERAVDWEQLVDAEGNTVGVIMNRSYSATEVLACAYDIVDSNGVVRRKVGRRFDEPQIVDPFDANATTFYFKLLKPADDPDPFQDYSDPDNPTGENEYALTWEYELRYFYDLLGRDISTEGFEVRIEKQSDQGQFPEKVFPDETQDQAKANLYWNQVFGLDTQSISGDPGADGVADINDPRKFDLGRGFIQFPLTTPFAPPDAAVADFSDGLYPMLESNLAVPLMYRKALKSQVDVSNAHKFDIVVKQTAVTSQLRLNAFNIKEGSEEVTLNGRVLSRDVDYTIDYFSGEVNLINEAAASLNSQSNIGVKFEVDPLFGGGRTSLNGMNLTYKLGRQNSLSTTWLLQTKPNNASKPRLGEEPSKNWVGNVAGKFRFSPGWVRSLANLMPLVDSDQEVTASLDAEVAVSIPNPNTQREAYLEDFESVDESINVTMSREGWWWASLPAEYDEGEIERRFGPDDRAYAGWHRPEALKREFINPTLSEQEQRDVLPTLELRVVSKDPSTPWSPDEYAGIQRTFGGDLDFSQAQFLEFWLDDGTGRVAEADLEALRPGRLHFDFGIINEDFFWKKAADGSFILGEEDDEDQDNDGLLNFDEDTGLDEKPSSEETSDDQLIPNRPGVPGDPAGDDYDATADEARLFVYINGTERNQRLDSEDIDRNGSFDKRDGYFSISLELSDLESAIVDIYRDYADFPDFIADREAANHSWRKYRLDLRDIVERAHAGGSFPYRFEAPDLSRVRTVRIWYEDDSGGPADRRIRLSEMRFLGNRWISESVRDSLDNLVDETARSGQDFRLGVLNNKENPDYRPPIAPDEQNNVAEKEQSLQFLYTDLLPGNAVRARKDLPGRSGQDYTKYGELNYFWREPYRDGVPDLGGADYVDAYFWVGSDSLNYYEIVTRFGEVEPGDVPLTLSSTGWQESRVRISDLTNIKEIGEEVVLDPTAETPETVRKGKVADALTGETYYVTVRGRPDLRRVLRYYAGVRYPMDAAPDSTSRISGSVLLNEFRLKEVDDEMGFAQRYAGSLSIPGFGDFQYDWSRTDQSFRGLNQEVGSGVTRTAWSARASSNLSNFLPTFGIDVPFSVNQREDLDEPKYKTLSDVELLDAQARNEEKSYSIARNFSFQVRKTEPSKWRLLQYTIDRFSMSMSGARSDRYTPTSVAKQFSLDRTFNYDLRLRTGFGVKIPWMKEKLQIVPNQVTLAAKWTDDDRQAWDKTDSGQRIERLPQETRTNTNNATLTFQPLRTLRGSFSISSNRNLMLDTDGEKTTWLLPILHVGKEEVFSQRWNMAWKSELRWLRWMKPDVEFNGAYQETRRPGVRQTALSDDDSINDDGYIGNPGQVRNVSGNGDLSLRGQIDLTGWLKKRFQKRPEAPRPSAAEVRREERRRSGGIDRGRRPATPDVPGIETPPTAPADSTAAGGETAESVEGTEGAEGSEEPDQVFTPPPDEEAPTLSPEDREARQREEAERQRLQRQEEAERLRREREGEVVAEDDAEDGEGEEVEQEADPMAALAALARPFKNLVVNLSPISSSVQLQRQSAYTQTNARAPWLYRLGLSHDASNFEGEEYEVPTELGPNGEVVRTVGVGYNTDDRQNTQRYNFSTQSQLTDDIRVDSSYTYRIIEREGTRGGTTDRSREFPVVGFRVSRVNEWPIFGDLFSSSNIDFNFKRTWSEKTTSAVSGSYPKTSLSLQPRWTFRFQNGLDANVNVSWNKDETPSPVSTLHARNLRANLKLQKNFDADGALSFLRFGRRGTGSTIDMNVDIGYSNTLNYRDRDGKVDQESGQNRYSVNPDFNYQFSRNLRAGLRLEFSRSYNKATEATSTTVGLFLNATLNF